MKHHSCACSFDLFWGDSLREDWTKGAGTAVRADGCRSLTFQQQGPMWQIDWLTDEGEKEQNIMSHPAGWLRVMASFKRLQETLFRGLGPSILQV